MASKSRESFRLLIAEEALRSPKGHWPEYIRTIADACRTSGDEVTIAAHKNAAPEVLSQLDATPVLPYSAWDGIYQNNNPLFRYGGVALHNRRLYRSMASFFESSAPFDCVLAPTILIHHLLAWLYLARRFAGVKFTRLTLVFVNGQGIYQGPSKPVLFPRHPKRTVFRKALQGFRPLVESGQVVLGAETEAMAKEYETFCGLPFARFPHPVDFSPPRKTASDTAAPVFSCLGFARHEKGSDLLQNAIIQFRRRRPDLNARFVIQWLDDFQDANGQIVTKAPELLSDPNVEFITGPIDTQRYLSELSRTSAMVLPYRASSYYSRVSRVAIEAAIMGIPLLYTRHTWLEELVSKCGAGIGFKDENIEDLVTQLVYLTEHLPELKNSAESQHEIARETYSPHSFRKILFEDMPNRHAPQSLPAVASATT